MVEFREETFFIIHHFNINPLSALIMKKESMDLLERLRAEDQQALLELRALYYYRFYARYKDCFSHPDDFAALFDDALLVVWGMRYELPHTGAVHKYLQETVHHMSASVCRQSASRKQLQVVSLEDIDEAELAAIDPPEQSAEEWTLFVERLEAAIEDLSPQQSYVMQALLTNRLSRQELVAELDIAETTLRVIISQSISALRKKLNYPSPPSDLDGWMRLSLLLWLLLYFIFFKKSIIGL